jgi:hypothetical protein
MVHRRNDCFLNHIHILSHHLWRSGKYEEVYLHKKNVHIRSTSPRREEFSLWMSI